MYKPKSRAHAAHPLVLGVCVHVGLHLAHVAQTGVCNTKLLGPHAFLVPCTLCTNSGVQVYEQPLQTVSVQVLRREVAETSERPAIVNEIIKSGNKHPLLTLSDIRPLSPRPSC